MSPPLQPPNTPAPNTPAPNTPAPNTPPSGPPLSHSPGAAPTAPTASATPPTPLLWRIAPPVVRPSRLAMRPVERNVLVYRRTWLIIVSGFFEPVFYLLSIRIGLGALVGDVSNDGRVVDYATFVAPALMASSAMNGALYDSTMNIYFKLRYARIFDSMLAAPLGAGDVALGEITWALIRGQIYAVMFLVVMAAMGLVESWWVLLALPACALIGFAFAAAGMMFTTYFRSWADFEWVPTAMMPLFLFSATFYPAATYGRWEWALQLSPLFHGVALVRAANEGVWAWSLVGHIAVLVAIAGACMVIVARRIDSLLRS